MQQKVSSPHGLLSVAVDATPLLGARTGVGQFCLGAIGGLAARRDLSVRAFAVSWRRRGELAEKLPPAVSCSQRSMPARPLHRAWSHLPVPPVEMFIGAVDVVHGTNYVVPPTWRAARVMTVHDLTTVRYPQMCDSATLEFPRLVRRAADAGAWVHTPSQYVATEVCEELGVDPARVRAVHHGIPQIAEPAKAGVSTVAEEASLTQVRDEVASRTSREVRRYLLAIGTIEPRKDYPLLVRAFDELADEVGDVALVIVGTDGWGSRALERALERARHSSRVWRTGYLTDSLLAPLLSGAAVVAYPSVYEGFGFVPLQAMAAGVPVVATSVGAIPEVTGDAALLVPPQNAPALARAMYSVLADEEVARSLRERGRAWAARFTWEACATGLSALYFEAAR